MASVVLSIPKVTSSSTSWTNPLAVLQSDTLYTTATSLVDKLLVSDFEDIIPTDATIDGIEVTVRGKGVSSPTVTVELTVDGSTAYSSAYTTAAFGTSASSEVLGGAADLWGLGSIPPGDIRGNANFGLLLRSDVDYAEIDYVTVEVFYTSTTAYLIGSRSSFPIEIDTFPTIRNGLGPENLIKSEDVNKLGDALFNIEKTLIYPNSSGKLKGRFKTVLYSVEFSCAIAGATAYIEYERSYRKKGSETIEAANSVCNVAITAESITALPAFTADFNLVSAIGWCDTGAALTPLYISGASFRRQKDNRNDCYLYSFTAINAAEVASVSNLDSDWFSSYGHKGSAIYSNTTIPAGTITIKFLCMGTINA